MEKHYYDSLVVLTDWAKHAVCRGGGERGNYRVIRNIKYN